jgi:uncharacterized protein YcbX
LEGRKEYELGRTLADSFFDAAPVHIVTDKTLQEIFDDTMQDVEKFWPNILLRTDGSLNDVDLLGREIQIGGAVFKVVRRTRRCIITSLAQREIDEDLNILRRIYAGHGGYVGVYATVSRSGKIKVGDHAKVP